MVENLREKLMDRRVDARSEVLKQGDELCGLSTLPWWLQDGLKLFKIRQSKDCNKLLLYHLMN